MLDLYQSQLNAKQLGFEARAELKGVNKYVLLVFRPM